MPFSLFRKKPKPPTDPLEAFDGVLNSMERQGQELRKSAATLLALRTQLMRDEEKLRHQLSQVNARLEQAKHLADELVETTLMRDEQALRSKLEKAANARVQVESDAALLSSAATEHLARLEALRAERQTAQARLEAGLTVSEALRSRVEEVDRVLKLDRARDEIERAQALADIYREEASSKAK